MHQGGPIHKNRAEDIAIANATDPTPVYNDNRVCVDWAATATTKGIKHLNLGGGKVRKAHATTQVIVKHISGAVNSSDLLTKDLKDAGLYRQLRDTIMVSKANFLRHHHNVPAHMAGTTVPPFYSQAAMPVAAAMVTPNCSARSSTTNHVRVDRPARHEPARDKPTYADVVSDSSAARRVINHS